MLKNISNNTIAQTKGNYNFFLKKSWINLRKMIRKVHEVKGKKPLHWKGQGVYCLLQEEITDEKEYFLSASGNTLGDDLEKVERGFLMKYIKQFGILLLLAFTGEILHHIIPLMIPASIYGILLLFLCLECRILKLEDVKETGAFLLEILPIMFIPTVVGLMDAWELIRPDWFSYLLITAVSTVVVMVISGVVTQALLDGECKEDENHE